MKNHDNSSSNPLFGYMTEQEGKTIQNLLATLDANDIPPAYYRVGGYSEEAACMEKSDAGWVVYVGERGNRYELTAHKTLKSACRRLLNQVAESDEQCRKMTEDFNEKCLTRVRIKLFPISSVDTVTAGVSLAKATNKEIIRRAKQSGKGKVVKAVKIR